MYQCEHFMAMIVSIHMSETITGAFNDASLVLYRVNEHVHKKVPVLVQEKVTILLRIYLLGERVNCKDAEHICTLYK